MILNIILAVIMLGVVIFVHEFGHFIVAKANGVTVVEFSIGFGPKLLRMKKGETEYCLKLIPFGGACLMLGDDLMAEGMFGKDDEETEEENDTGRKLAKGYDKEKAFSNKSVWSRIAIIAAGPIFNFLLAFVFAIVIIGSVGADPCVVDVVEENSPAAAAGLQVGDEIVKINHNAISFSKEFAFYMSYHAKEEMHITYRRGKEKFTATVQPIHRTVRNYRVGITISNNSLVNEVLKDSPADKAGLKARDVIVSVDNRMLTEKLLISQVLSDTKDKEVEVVVNRQGEEIVLKMTPQLVETEEYYTGFDSYGYRVKCSPMATVKYAFMEVGYWIEAVVKSVGMMFTGQVTVNDLSGPVGVVDAVSNVVEQSKPDGAWYVFLNVLNFTVMISANLGVMNLLPLPALDGGRLVFMLIEVVRGKPVKKEHEGIVHFVGMVLLMILMVYILFKDIKGLF